MQLKGKMSEIPKGKQLKITYPLTWREFFKGTEFLLTYPVKINRGNTKKINQNYKSKRKQTTANHSKQTTATHSKSQQKTTKHSKTQQNTTEYKRHRKETNVNKPGPEKSKNDALCRRYFTTSKLTPSRFLTLPPPPPTHPAPAARFHYLWKISTFPKSAYISATLRF